MGVEQKLGNMGIMTTTLENVVNWSRTNAMWPEPKWVIAMGDCASCSGVFNNYALVQGVDEIVPVDVYVAGCPPRPEALIHGVVTLYEKVKGEKFKDVVVK